MNRSRPGFTFIELIAATTIASLMMIAVLQVIGLLAVQRRQGSTHIVSYAWQWQLSDLLRWDCANSRTMRLENRRVVLRGFAGRGERSRHATFLPTEVSYWIERHGEQSWLMRRETQLDNDSNRYLPTERVCAGVTDIGVHWPGDDRLPAKYYTDLVIPNPLTVTLVAGTSRQSIPLRIEF